MGRIAGQVVAIAALTGIWSGAATPQGAKSNAASEHQIDQLGWLAGTWRGTSHGAATVEMWTAPAGGMMLGVAQAYTGEKTRNFEFMRIEPREDGGLAYVAQPNGNKPTVFPLTKIDGQQAVFENPQHDMPRRIIYKRNGDELLARIEGEVNSKPASDDYIFKRVTE